MNSVLGNGWAVELDVSSNTCIVQNVNLKQGKHILKFNWAARANTQLSTNGILVILNRQLLKGIAPTDYALHTESLEFYINSNASVELALCGAGTPDGYGTLVNNIDLKFEDESLYRINKYWNQNLRNYWIWFTCNLFLLKFIIFIDIKSSVWMLMNYNKRMKR